MVAKKKIVKKKAVTKKKAVKKQSVKKKPIVKKKATVRKKRTVKKSPPAKKKSTGRRTKAQRKKAPIPKYHINLQSWDREAAITALCEIIITSSKGLARICAENTELPSLRSIMSWLDEEAKSGGGPLLQRYARAKESQADYMADEILDIADNHANEPLVIDGVPVVVNGELIRMTTPASVNHAKLRIDSRKWCASKLRPHVYGDKLELSGNPDRPLASLTDEQLAVRRKQLEDKLAEHGAE